MTSFYNQNKITKVLQHHQIEFKLNNIIEVLPDQDLGVIPNKKIVTMLGIKQDKGHQVFIEKLNQIESNWLLIFLKYESYYDVYNTDGEIIKENFNVLINEILDGLQ